jgi:hypothetical protein
MRIFIRLSLSWAYQEEFLIFSVNYILSVIYHWKGLEISFPDQLILLKTVYKVSQYVFSKILQSQFIANNVCQFESLFLRLNNL